MKRLKQQFVAKLNYNKDLTDYLFRTTGVTFTWQDRFRVCGEHIAIQDGTPANVQRGLKFELPECVRAAVGLTGHWLQLEALVTSDPPCPGLPATTRGLLYLPSSPPTYLYNRSSPNFPSS